MPEAVKGKLVYGCLEKSQKAQVDDIVDELENLPVVADCYAAWDKLELATSEAYWVAQVHQKMLDNIS